MKVFIVALVILAVLFGLTIALGAGKGDDPKREGPGGFEQTLGKLAKPFRPKVDLPKKTFAVGDHPIPKSESPFRAVTFEVPIGCAVKLKYEVKGKEKSDLNPQEAELPQGGGEKGRRTVFTFLKEGGVLTVPACTSGHKPCPGKVTVVEE